MKIVGYKIVSNRNTELLADTVQLLIADNWQPVGNLITTPIPRSIEFQYHQALVKYKEK